MSSGCSAAWLARYLGVVEVVGSNPASPTLFPWFLWYSEFQPSRQKATDTKLIPLSAGFLPESKVLTARVSSAACVYWGSDPVFRSSEMRFDRGFGTTRLARDNRV